MELVLYIAAGVVLGMLMLPVVLWAVGMALVAVLSFFVGLFEIIFRPYRSIDKRDAR